MTDVNFYSALIQKGVIHQDSEINANYKGIDLSGSAYLKYNGIFTITDILENEDKIIFNVSSIEDGAPRQISSEDITKIDGMEISRIANVYGLHPNSKKRKKGRRRSSAEVREEKEKLLQQKLNNNKEIDLSNFSVFFG